MIEYLAYLTLIVLLVILLARVVVRHYIARMSIDDIIADIKANDYDAQTLRFMIIRLNYSVDNLLFYPEQYDPAKPISYIVNHCPASGKLKPKEKKHILNMLNCI